MCDQVAAVQAKLIQQISAHLTVFSGYPRNDREIQVEIFVGQIPIEISGDIPGYPVKIGEANPCEVHISEEKKHINVNKMLPVFFLQGLGFRV